MKTVSAVIVLLLACGLAVAQMGQQQLSAPEAEQLLLQQVEASGPAAEAPGQEMPVQPLGRGFVPSNIGGYYKYTLRAPPGMNFPGRAVFEIWPLQNSAVWKLTVWDFPAFTGAHIHLADESQGNPIWVHLVPEFGQGDFIPPTNFQQKTWSGSFGTEELSRYGINSIDQWWNNWVRTGRMYVNTHTMQGANALRAFLG